MPNGDQGDHDPVDELRAQVTRLLGWAYDPHVRMTQRRENAVEELITIREKLKDIVSDLEKLD